MGEKLTLTDEQFYALENWIIAVASHVALEATAPGFSDPANMIRRRDLARLRLTEAGRLALQETEK